MKDALDFGWLTGTALKIEQAEGFALRRIVWEEKFITVRHR